MKLRISRPTQRHLLRIVGQPRIHRHVLGVHRHTLGVHGHALGVHRHTLGVHGHALWVHRHTLGVELHTWVRHPLCVHASKLLLLELLHSGKVLEVLHVLLRGEAGGQRAAVGGRPVVLQR